MSELEPAPKFVKKRVGRNLLASVPKISVIMPAYNIAPYIAEALQSVREQKFREYEIIVVNDGSPDTREMEQALAPFLEDIIYITQRNAGCGPARNTALEHARGEFIAFLDGDDVWLPDFLTSQYVQLQRRGLDMIYCDALLFGTNSAYRRTFMETAPSVGTADFNSILAQVCNVIISGTIARKSSIIKAGAFENANVRAQDYHLWLRMAKSGAKIGYQREVLAKYRVRPDGLTGDTMSGLRREIDALNRVRRDIPLTPEELAIADNRTARLTADLAVEQGKSHLLQGDPKSAITAFQQANHHRHSLKLTAIILMAKLAPSVLLSYYRKHRKDELSLNRKPA